MSCIALIIVLIWSIVLLKDVDFNEKAPLSPKEYFNKK